MESVFEILYLRRPVLNYVCPPVCEVLFSGTSTPIIVLDPFLPSGAVSGAERGGSGGFQLSWNRYPGAICYSVYQADNEDEPFGTYHLIAECIPDPTFTLPPGRGPFRVTAITPDGETPPSAPIYGADPPVSTPVVTVEATDDATACDESPGVFTFTRTAPLTGPLVINYTVGGTADPGVDYDALSGTATIPDGLSFVDVDVFPLDSGLLSTKTVTVTILPDVAYDIGTPDDALITIGTCANCADPGFWDLGTGANSSGGIASTSGRALNCANSFADLIYFDGVDLNNPLSTYRLASNSGLGLSQSGTTATANGAFFLPGDVGKFLYWPSLTARYRITSYISPTQVQVATSNTIGTDRDSSLSGVTATQTLDVVTASANFFLPADVGTVLSWHTSLDAFTIIAYISPTQVQVDTSSPELAQDFTVQLLFDADVEYYSIAGTFGNARVNSTGDIAISQSGIYLYKVEDLGLPTLKVSGPSVRRLNKAGNILATNGTYYYRDGTTLVVGLVPSIATTGIGSVGDTAYRMSQDSDRLLEFQRDGTLGQQLRIWNNGVLTTLNPLPFPAAPTNAASHRIIKGWAMSPNGCSIVSVQGFSPTVNNGNLYWFLIDQLGNSFPFPFLDAANGDILGCHSVNDSGQSALNLKNGAVNRYTALGNANGTTTIIPYLAGRTTGDSQSINASGKVVGFHTLAGVNTAFIYFDGVTHDLNSYLDPALVAAGWVLSIADLITDDGYIWGRAKLSGVDHTFSMCHADFV
jgi:hypothetical protein